MTGVSCFAVCSFFPYQHARRDSKLLSVPCPMEDL